MQVGRCILTHLLCICQALRVPQYSDIPVAPLASYVSVLTPLLPLHSSTTRRVYIARITCSPLKCALGTRLIATLERPLWNSRRHQIQLQPCLPNSTRSKSQCQLH